MNDLLTFQSIYKGTNFEIQKLNKDYYIIVHDKGVDYTAINEVLIEHNIRLTNFRNIRTAFTTEFHRLLPFGSESEKIVLEVSNDEMRAMTTFFMELEELNNREKIVAELDELLKGKGIIYGVDFSKILQAKELKPRAEIIIAQGDYPVDGEDSRIFLYDLNERKAREREDGSVDFQDIGFINEVTEGEWVGEWSKPSDGKMGMTIKGKPIEPVSGRPLRIPYDKQTIYEVAKEDRICLYAKCNGTVNIDKYGHVSISNHITLENVDYNTGNIDFDGSVLVKGTVLDGFSVIATRDIEILSKDGVGSVDKIVSKSGNIRIAGGINGKGKTVIKGINLQCKYISNAKVFVQENLNVSDYITHSYVESRNINMKNLNAFIAASTLKDIYTIRTSILGNEAESKVSIEFMTTDVKMIKDQFHLLQKQIQENREQIKKLDQLICSPQVPEDKTNAAKSIKSELLYVIEMIEKDCESIKNRLRRDGEGIIEVQKGIYPGVRITTATDFKIFTSKALSIKIQIKHGNIHSN